MWSKKKKKKPEFVGKFSIFFSFFAYSFFNKNKIINYMFSLKREQKRKKNFYFFTTCATKQKKRKKNVPDSETLPYKKVPCFG